MPETPQGSAATKGGRMKPGDEGHRPGDPAPNVWYENNAASIPDNDPNGEFREWPVCSDCGGDVDGQPPEAVHV